MSMPVEVTPAVRAVRRECSEAIETTIILEWLEIVRIPLLLSISLY